MNTVHVLGDSISMHYGPYLEKYLDVDCRYSRKEGESGNMDVLEGANGGDSSMVLEYLNKCYSEQLHWDLLLINCGLHDIKRNNGKFQVDPLEYESNIQKIFELAGRLCEEIIWIQTTPVFDDIHNSRKKEFERYNADVEKYNQIAESIAILEGIQVVDLNTFCHALGAVELYEDHVHFKSDVCKLQGAFIAGHINAILQAYS